MSARPGREDSDPYQLVIPETRPPLVRASLWLVVVAGVQFVAFAVALASHPAGFDDCEASPTRGEEMVQAGVAGAALLGTAAIVLWRLKGALRLACLAVLAASSLAWFLLLGSEQVC